MFSNDEVPLYAPWKQFKWNRRFLKLLDIIYSNLRMLEFNREGKRLSEKESKREYEREERR